VKIIWVYIYLSAESARLSKTTQTYQYQTGCGAGTNAAPPGFRETENPFQRQSFSL